MKIEGVKVRSFFPGRVRLKVEALKGKPELAGRVQADLAGIDAIQSVEVHPDTGSVTLRYDRKAIRSPASVDALVTTLGRHFPHIDFEQIRGWLASGSDAG